MENKLKIFILFAVVWKCNGHLGLLGGILSSAHDRIHSKVENVAGTVLGGISHGLDFNFGGHIATNGYNHPDNGAYNPNRRPGDTVIVVIKEEDGDDGFRPPNQNQRPNGPPNNNEYRPNNHYIPHNQRPNNIPNRENYNQHNQFNQHNQPSGNNYPDNQHGENGNFNKPPYNQHQGNNYGHTNTEYPQHNNYNQNNNFNRPNNNNDYGPDNFAHNQVTPTVPFDKSTRIPEKSPTEYVTKKPDFKPKEEETTTKPDDDDAPFFIPLNPNEYTYGGDKINVTAPKRDTNNAEPKDEDFNIDIRIKDT